MGPPARFRPDRGGGGTTQTHRASWPGGVQVSQGGPNAISRLRTQASEAASETAFALLDGLWHGPVGLAVLDPALRFLQVNEPLADVNGVPAAAHVGRTFPEVAAGGDAALREEMERLEDACRVVIRTGRPFLNLVARGRVAHGRSREWLCSVFPILAPDGAVRGIVVMVSDATDDREREAALARARDDAQRSLRRQERLLEVTAALSQARTEEDVMSVLVLQADRAFGVSSSVAYVLRDGALELVASVAPAGRARRPPGRLPLDAPIPAAAAARAGAAIWLDTPADVAARFPAGGAVALDAPVAAVAALPLRIGQEVLGAVACEFETPGPFPQEERDLLAAAAEQCALALDRARLLDRERAAREAEARSAALLDALVENAPVGIAFFDRELRFRRLNPLLAEIDGIPVEAHLGKTPRELLPGLPQDALEKERRSVLETGRPVLDFEIEGETPAAPGKRRSWLTSWYPVRSKDEVLGVGALIREVTAEREAAEFQRNVLGIVGHDLRNPLAALANCAHLLVRAEDLPPERLRLVARILANAARIEQIVSVLLDYARVRSGHGLPLHRRPCDLASLAEAVADESEAAHPGREIRRAGSGDCSGRWDPDRIAQVLANLMSNALDHGTPGTPVELGWSDTGDTVVVEIANEGPPIPPDVLPRLFQPFRRAERQRAGGRDGLGLGLFIARAIAAAHGGALEVRSGQDERTVFTLRLPRGSDAG
jgi:PAS domain S-box-containing protein